MLIISDAGILLGFIKDLIAMFIRNGGTVNERGVNAAYRKSHEQVQDIAEDIRNEQEQER